MMEVYGSKISMAEAYNDIMNEGDTLCDARREAFNKITRCNYEWETCLKELNSLSVDKKVTDSVVKG